MKFLMRSEVFGEKIRFVIASLITAGVGHSEHVGEV
jgi:hypothetical protein